ncbi:unnamed protein product [Amoebophrya sp. A25]|nr:unnamed protein product [Amoebophrya sp. A25]|eukprot:GSA25T00025318001.1
MCSFLITNLLLYNLTYVNYFQKFRGPDYTNVVRFNNYIFVHNLLWQTGPLTPQPFWSQTQTRSHADGVSPSSASSRKSAAIVGSSGAHTPQDASVVALFNGEIYNYRHLIEEHNLVLKKTSAQSFEQEGNEDGATTAPSDGAVLLPLYEKFGTRFVHLLRGEFALAVYDFARKIALVATDAFGTKPAHFHVSSPGVDAGSNFHSKVGPQEVLAGLSVATYASALRRSLEQDNAVQATTQDRRRHDNDADVPSSRDARMFPELGIHLGEGVHQMHPNTVAVFSLDTGVLVEKRSFFEFDMRQWKNHTRDWVAAFDRSVRDRVQYAQHRVFLTLSSGFDSGLLHLAYLLLGAGLSATDEEDCQLSHGDESSSAKLKAVVSLPHGTSSEGRQKLLTFSVRGKEFVPLIEQRVAFSQRLRSAVQRDEWREIVQSSVSASDASEEKRNQLVQLGGPHTLAILLEFGAQTDEEELERLLRKCEPYRYQMSELPELLEYYAPDYLIWRDPAAKGLSLIYQFALRHGSKIFLSATGGDEIFAGDYGTFGRDSYGKMGKQGAFPSDAGGLAGIFPWHGFFLQRMRDYLMKEEMVAGVYGIEARFPFLDPAVVQEFLWLSAETKNSEYKRVIADYMRKRSVRVDSSRAKQDAVSKDSTRAATLNSLVRQATKRTSVDRDDHKRVMKPRSDILRYPFVGGKLGFSVSPWDAASFPGWRHRVTAMIKQ